MKKSDSMRKAISALLVFGLLAFFCWAVMFTVLCVTNPIPGGEHFFIYHGKQVLALLAFQKPNYYFLPSFFIWTTIVLVSFLLVLTFAFVIFRQKFMAIPAFLVLQASSIALIELVANFTRYSALNVEKAYGYLALFEDKEHLSIKLLVVCLMIAVIVGVIVSFVGYVVAFVYTCVYGRNYKMKPMVKRVRKSAPLVNTTPVQKPLNRRTSVFMEEPEPELARPQQRVVEQSPSLNKEDIKDIIREIIREELIYKENLESRRNDAPMAGPGFGGPFIVQYFNGLNPTETRAPVEQPEPQPVEEPEEEPVQEEPTPVVEEEPVVEPEPVIVPEAPVEEVEEDGEKKPIIRIPFSERLLASDKSLQDNYNEIKNEIMAYGVHSRVSNSGDTFRLHRKTFVKLTIAGKSLKLYFALNPEDYNSTTFPVQDVSHKNIYAEIPMVFKVKSPLSMKRCKQLIFDVMSQNDLVQGDIENKDWVNEIATAVKEGKTIESDEEDED